MNISTRVGSILLLICDIRSIISYLFVFIYVFSKKNIRSAPNNYVMLFMLFNSLILVCSDIPCTIYYYQRHQPIIQSPIFCLIWWFISICYSYSCQILAAWMSFERHILIFHSWIFTRKLKKICFHYLMPVLILLYTHSLYIYFIILTPCETRYELAGNSCSDLCYFSSVTLGLYETIGHGILTTICIVIFSSTLVLRIYWSKARLQQSVNWKKYRKMFYQLIPISTLYLSTKFPLCIAYILNYSYGTVWVQTIITCFSFLNYFIPIALPFVCIASLPNFHNTMKRYFRRRINRQIRPAI